MVTLDAAAPPRVTFDTDPTRYRHWKLAVDGRIATLTLDVDEDAGLVPGYKLKLNSYDLGVDIEFHDALQRIRFEHPHVGCVVVTSAKDRTFCAGANIYMLGTSSHAWKVNFCKFTNETRNGMEDSSRHDGLHFIAAVNGACAGGGYEIALACDEILMVDDRSTTVSLPEVPLLGVLPGTGGLTRLTDKRGVRRDLADVFCTNADGVRADRAKAWKLVDATAPPSSFAALVEERAAALAARSVRDAGARGITLPPLERRDTDAGWTYTYVVVHLERAARRATIVVHAPEHAQPADAAGIVAAGAAWWPLAMARELDDALLRLRTNERELGLLVLRTQGDPAHVRAVDDVLQRERDHWLVRETIGLLRRTFARLETTSRSLYAIVDEGSCFTGTLAELALAADRTYHLQLDDEIAGPAIAFGPLNLDAYPTVQGRSRLATRFAADRAAYERVAGELGRSYAAEDAFDAGLITEAPDELDWDDELRLAFEERAALSPDALTAMEQNLRFPGTETSETRIFGRLSAWQNWVFIRPNATGERGALSVFGTGTKPQFNQERV